jgi:murein DD-endopeptidase MepM/ murein hydrolase activator NlpD
VKPVLQPHLASASRPVRRPGGVASALLLALALVLVGCSSGSGFYHRVEPGENLYRIGLRYGVPARTLARANRVDDVRSMRPGTRLWIPRAAITRPAGGSADSVSAAPPHRRASRRPTQASEARRLARLDARRTSKLEFAWPLQAKLSSRFGQRRGRPHEGIDLSARKGAPIRAAEGGRIIHAGRLGDYGKVVVVKHAGHYRSVYAHASKVLVRKGQFVEKGDRIALVGSTGRSSGPHLHFEIRRRESARDPMLYLP